MSSVLAITAATNQIELDNTRRSETSFTVSNASGRPLRAGVRVEPASPALPDWFTIAGEAERAFPVDGTQQFTVQVAVPPTFATGSYSFRLDALNLENPDEDYVQGPVVAFNVTDKPVLVQTRKGYVPTLLGAIIGALAGAALGFLLGTIVGGLFGSSASGLGGTISTVLVAVITIAGGVLGAGLALRVGNYDHYIETVMVLAAAAPIFSAVVVLILVFLLNSPSILQEGGTPAVLLLCISGLLCFVVPPLLSRAIVLYMKTGKL
jgi:hypothetical protein